VALLQRPLIKQSWPEDGPATYLFLLLMPTSVRGRPVGGRLTRAAAHLRHAPDSSFESNALEAAHISEHRFAVMSPISPWADTGNRQNQTLTDS